jgi:hypothetical protein
MWEASNGIVETQADSGRDRCWQSFLDPADVWIRRLSAWLLMVSKRGDKELAQGSGVDFGANRPNLGARLHRRPHATLGLYGPR